MRRLYTLLLYLALPVASLMVGVRGLSERDYWRGWQQRFGFGPRRAGGARKAAWIDETLAPLQPRNIYGITKLQGEQYVQIFAAERGIKAAIVRLFNVIGPGETNPHLLPAIVAQLREGPESINLGNTWPKRDYIDVRDAAGGFAAIAVRARSTSSGLA